MRKPRKNYTPLKSEKVAILRRHLIDRVPVSDLCDEYVPSRPPCSTRGKNCSSETARRGFRAARADQATSPYLRTIAALAG